MVERERFPTAWPGCEISVVTEEMRDGRWAVVAAITENSPERTRTVDLPVSSQTFESHEKAQAFGVEQAQHWLDENMPRTEAA
ncbi:MAG TPA: hypothetical protein VGT02_11000 [Methylomirabilota bacterium]|jgi:hypothetical protein|nr:hypothetical protein [Methylomirabilota bacterium]